MKILLLTDIPPCKDYTAGIVLDQLCRFLPHDSIACFTVVMDVLNARLSSDLEWMPIQYEHRPRETFILFKKHTILHTLLNAYLYYYNGIVLSRIISKIVKFNQAFNADVLWCPLEGPTQIRLALPVAASLNIPLLTQVYDPPALILRDQETPRFLQAKLLNKFGSTIRRSRACATVSQNMAQKYAEDFNIKTIFFLPSLDPRIAQPPAQSLHASKDLIIGMGGQLYATEEWNALLTSLEAVNWKIGKRNVRIRLLGRWVSFNVKSPLRIEYLGWHNQEECIKLFSESDILYCPYWLNPVFEAEARLSFPSKLTTYLAAGRPVLFHGPEYASVAQFLKENDAGVCCHSNEPTQIIEALTVLATDSHLYSKLTRNGRAAFDKHLTLASLRKSFARFLEVEDSFLVPTT
jgi:glycosyltransferase involved in cell wall biosynthesis